MEGGPAWRPIPASVASAVVATPPPGSPSSSRPGSRQVQEAARPNSRLGNAAVTHLSPPPPAPAEEADEMDSMIEVSGRQQVYLYCLLSCWC